MISRKRAAVKSNSPREKKRPHRYIIIVFLRSTQPSAMPQKESNVNRRPITIMSPARRDGFLREIFLKSMVQSLVYILKNK
jgi:hypothetical protein